MPIVTGGGNDKITIEIDAKVDRLLKDLDKVEREFGEFQKAAKKADEATGLTAKNATSNWTDFRSAYSTVLDVVRVGQQIWGATVNELVAYGDQVQRLSTITGQSAEEVSRQIQLADDLRVSYESLSRSLQFASRKGVDTSIDGLVRLGEEYKKLPKGIERTQFLMEKFGRGGVEMNKILSQTSETIRELAANTPDGLIITDKDLQDLKEYNRSLDEMTDLWGEFKMQVGKELVPRASDFMVGLMHQAELWRERNKLLKEGVPLLEANRRAMENVKAELYGTADATGEATDGMEEFESGTDEADQTVKRLSQSLTGLLSSMFKIQGETDKYNETLTNLAGKDAELAAEKNQLTLKMWEEQRAGEMTNETYLEYVQRLDEITKKQQENAEAITKAKEDNAKASEQRVYDLVQERLAADGLIDTGEFEFLQKLAVTKGLVSKAAADQAIAESNAADQYIQNFQQTQPAMQQTLALMQQIAAYDGRIVNFGVNYSTSGSVPGGYGNIGYRPYSPVTSGGRGMRSRDSGGPGIAGQPYMIGTGAQPELFVPNTSGTFYPNADKMGSTYNITINNPKKEAAENSIRQALKKLSFIGVAQ